VSVRLWHVAGAMAASVVAGVLVISTVGGGTTLAAAQHPSAAAAPGATAKTLPVSAAAGSGAAGSTVAPAVAAASDAATRQAVASRRAVAVDALTTATTRTMAEPDGTFQLDANAQPVRVRSGKAWVPVDTTFRRTVSGISTTATTMPLTVGAAGATMLATLTVGGGV